MQRKWPCCLVPKLHHVNDSPFIHTHCTLSMQMSRTSSHSKQVLVCLCILGNDSVAKVQSLSLTSSFFLFFCVSDSKRPFQQGDPSLLWTPSRFPKYCSRSSHLQCSPVPKTGLAQTNTHVCTHKHIHSLLIPHFQNLRICSASSETCHFGTVTYHDVSLTHFLNQIM